MARLTCVYINTCSLCLRQIHRWPRVLVNAVVIGTVVVVVLVRVIAVVLVTFVAVIVVVALCAWPQVLVNDIVTPGRSFNEALICPLLMYFCLWIPFVCYV